MGGSRVLEFVGRVRTAELGEKKKGTGTVGLVRTEYRRAPLAATMLGPGTVPVLHHAPHSQRCRKMETGDYLIGHALGQIGPSSNVIRQ